MTKLELYAEVARYLDAAHEEWGAGKGGIEAFHTKEGIDIEALVELVAQRATRAWLVSTGQSHLLDLLKILEADGDSAMVAVGIPQEVLVAFSMAEMDGFVIGYLVAKREARENES